MRNEREDNLLTLVFIKIHTIGFNYNMPDFKK